MSRCWRIILLLLSAVLATACRGRARPVRTVGRRGVVAARRLRVVVVDKTAAAGEAVSVARVLVRAHHQQREQGQGNYSFARSARACRRELSG
jgi:hypothetical protein